MVVCHPCNRKKPYCTAERVDAWLLRRRRRQQQSRRVYGEEVEVDAVVAVAHIENERQSQLALTRVLAVVHKADRGKAVMRLEVVGWRNLVVVRYSH